MKREDIEQESLWIFEKMRKIRDLGGGGGDSYSYYQGRIDSLAWVLRQVMKEEGARNG